jgi:hypothetical protein
MKCPQCDDMVIDIIEHYTKCPMDLSRLLSVGLIDLREFEIINSNRNGDKTARTALSPKQK